MSRGAKPRLSDDTVAEILRAGLTEAKTTTLAERFGVSDQLIRNLLSGRCWQALRVARTHHIPIPRPTRPPRSSASNAERALIRSYLGGS